jgi:hypothetical protein
MFNLVNKHFKSSIFRFPIELQPTPNSNEYKHNALKYGAVSVGKDTAAVITKRRRQLDLAEKKVATLFFDFMDLGKQIKKHLDIYDIVKRQVSRDEQTTKQIASKEVRISNRRIKDKAKRKRDRDIKRKDDDGEGTFNYIH